MKQERSQVTRDRLIEAAGEVFARAGFESARLADIAQLAGVTTGALYFNFDGKEALAANLIQRQSDIATTISKEALERPGEALESMVQLSLDWARLIGSDPVAAGVRLILERPDLLPDISTPYAHWFSVAEQFLRRADANGELARHIDPDEVAFIFTAAFVGVDILSGAVQARERLIARVQLMWDVLLYGIADTRKAPGAARILRGTGATI
ncbi:ScbR family autoregulator-binding transcription factor [Microbacterium rhizomatis]|uniref:TetR/AcrR family transcriptional regulator n=1 Tax=Microbacterium rhizomatis TaxID=1631477 RepID=A0A5J5J5D4_9MICO|nr:ScbR family autoregulator-binding transcription factor [Microbacterium rhizomatis]KAA9111387.1 TetR/AcrR family transcriptional regulator [Microbacterium rhizomatis]